MVATNIIILKICDFGSSLLSLTRGLKSNNFYHLTRISKFSSAGTRQTASMKTTTIPRQLLLRLAGPKGHVPVEWRPGASACRVWGEGGETAKIMKSWHIWDTRGYKKPRSVASVALHPIAEKYERIKKKSIGMTFDTHTRVVGTNLGGGGTLSQILRVFWNELLHLMRGYDQPIQSTAPPPYVKASACASFRTVTKMLDVSSGL